MKDLEIFMYIYAPNLVVLVLYQSQLIVQPCAHNVHEHNACQDDCGVTKFDIHFHQQQPQNLDGVMIN
jgi:hypothetical protein